MWSFFRSFLASLLALVIFAVMVFFFFAIYSIWADASAGRSKLCSDSFILVGSREDFFYFRLVPFCVPRFVDIINRKTSLLLFFFAFFLVDIIRFFFDFFHIY